MKNIMKYKGGSMMPEYLANNEETVHRLPDAKAMRFNAKMFIGNSRGAFRSQALERNGQLLNAERKLEANALSMKQKLQKQTAFTDSTDFGGNFFSNNRILERKKRETLVDWNCSEAGETTEVDADYVHLCKICSGKRYLPVDRYPRYVNEVRCSATENSCLGNNNGKCVETQFNAHLLKRKVGECRLCVKETEVLAVDEWEVYIEPIRVGCECILNKKSNYRQQWFSAGSN
ncbi:hypothetical protein EB796_000003 [Bugula neritina]|uniref:Uncharacterized protein n=1 Tax=Bugula neritina TaxID=10212 RepID=A0A7J7KU26_BUGNE|nr:hypothetical protein EB796_000003 [Bugula neritina]